MEEKKFLYSVNPRRVIKNVADIPAIRTSKSLFLDKEEVLKCIKCGTVYRRFSADDIVKVTPATLDRLHREEFMSEKEYAEYLANSQGKDRGTITTVDAEEAPADENTSHEIRETSAQDEKASNKSSEVLEETEADVVNSENKPAEDQAKAVNNNGTIDKLTTDRVETDANDLTSDSEGNAVAIDPVSVSEPETEKEPDSTSDQSTDETADVKNDSFQKSSIQVNTSGKKKYNKKKH